MYYALRPECYFRKYGEIGYLYNSLRFTDEVVDLQGAIFLEKLNYGYQDIDTIVNGLLQVFDGVSAEEIKTDATCFYNNLVSDEFLLVSDKLEGSYEVHNYYGSIEKRMAKNYMKSDARQSSYSFLEKYFNHNPFLISFHAELTSKCNERCVHCYIPHEDKNSEVSDELMFNVIRQCSEMGVLTIVFSGGEPMLHPHFLDFVRYAKDLDINVVVLTNLTLLSDSIIECLKYKHPSCVNVSLYSMIPEVHDSITTIKGSFNITKNNILKLLEHGISVQINCPLMQENKESFQEVITWGEDHNCSVNVDYLIMARNDKSTDNLQHRLYVEDLEKVITKIVERDKVFQENLQTGIIVVKSDDKSDRVCGVGLTTLSMNCGGMVYPCAGWQKFNCGDLNQVTLKEIWYKSPHVKYLRQLRMKDFKQCSGCSSQKYCQMCMARNSNEDSNGDIFNIPQITCEAAYIQHKVVDEYRNKFAKM